MRSRAVTIGNGARLGCRPVWRGAGDPTCVGGSRRECLLQRISAIDWHAQWREAFAGTGQAWVFVLKGVLAMTLGAWLAMRLDLQKPYEVMVTCAIVINPNSGMVMAKSFYRVLGTIVGCLAGVMLVAAFPQQRVLLLLGMALWVGMCAGGASLFRNFKSYGFVLAGYTAAIVVLPALQQPQLLFQSALMRFSEVMLGILVATFISEIIAPRRLTPAFRASLRAQFTGFIEFVRGSMEGALERSELQQAHLRFVSKAVEVENLRSSIVVEDAGARALSPRVQRLNQRFMAASTSYQSLHHLMNRLQDADHMRARTALVNVFAVLAHALEQVDAQARVPEQAEQLRQALAGVDERLREQVVAQRAALEQRQARLDFDTGAELTVRFARELKAYAAAYAALVKPRTRERGVHRNERGFARGNDWLGASSVVVRVAAVMLVTGWFWIVTAWPGGPYAMLLSTIFCGLLASKPNPVAAVRVMSKGFMAGVVAGFVCLFGVLVHMDGFVLLMAGLLPFLILGFYPFANPKYEPIARGYLLSFFLMMQIDTVMVYDLPMYLDQAMGLLFGVMMTAVSYRLFANAADNRFLHQRLMDKLRAEVTRACRAPLDGARERMESAGRDLFMQVMGYNGAGRLSQDEFLGWGLSVHETGRAIVDLRRDMATAPPALHRRLQAVIDTVGDLYEAPSRGHYVFARRRLASAIRASSGQPRVLRHLHLLRLVLLDRQSVLARYMASRDAGVDHAT